MKQKANETMSHYRSCRFLSNYKFTVKNSRFEVLSLKFKVQGLKRNIVIKCMGLKGFKTKGFGSNGFGYNEWVLFSDMFTDSEAAVAS